LSEATRRGGGEGSIGGDGVGDEDTAMDTGIMATIMVSPLETISK